MDQVKYFKSYYGKCREDWISYKEIEDWNTSTPEQNIVDLHDQVRTEKEGGRCGIEKLGTIIRLDFYLGNGRTIFVEFQSEEIFLQIADNLKKGFICSSLKGDLNMWIEKVKK